MKGWNLLATEDQFAVWPESQGHPLAELLRCAMAKGNLPTDAFRILVYTEEGLSKRLWVPRRPKPQNSSQKRKEGGHER